MNKQHKQRTTTGNKERTGPYSKGTHTTNASCRLYTLICMRPLTPLTVQFSSQCSTKQQQRELRPTAARVSFVEQNSRHPNALLPPSHLCVCLFPLISAPLSLGRLLGYSQFLPSFLPSLPVLFLSVAPYSCLVIVLPKRHPPCFFCSRCLPTPQRTQQIKKIKPNFFHMLLVCIFWTCAQPYCAHAYTYPQYSAYDTNA